MKINCFRENHNEIEVTSYFVSYESLKKRSLSNHAY